MIRKLGFLIIILAVVYAVWKYISKRTELVDEPSTIAFSLKDKAKEAAKKLVIK